MAPNKLYFTNGFIRCLDERRVKMKKTKKKGNTLAALILTCSLLIATAVALIGERTPVVLKHITGHPCSLNYKGNRFLVPNDGKSYEGHWFKGKAEGIVEFSCTDGEVEILSNRLVP
jgi:hypothetical protein